VTTALDPARFTMKTMFKRLHAEGDLWKDVLGPGIDIVRCLVRLETLLER
jgi:bifunctional non-homologous end joining protein LigD